MNGPKIRRRHFLIGAAGGAGAALVAPQGADLRAFAQEGGGLPEYADWKDAEAVIVHSANTIETERGAITASVVTPSDRLFVRNNITTPGEEIVADRDAWQVSFEGVTEPRMLTVGELKRLGLDTVTTVLQCSGNGRGLFDHDASGTHWITGAAGCVVWSGVPVQAVVEALGGIAEGARFMTSTGGEPLPEGIDPREVVVERSVPVANAESALLAWEMNGEPIPRVHGGPLRMIVPGYYGVNNVKFVKAVAFAQAESPANIMTSGYRVRPVGVDGAPDQPSMWEMKVKSWVTYPLADPGSGLVQIHGVAFGGVNAVAKVEVSIDGGATWQEATLIGPGMGRYAWRAFVLPAELGSGTYTITSRATDSQGNVQSETTEPNHRAYDYSGWDRLAVEVTVA